MQPSWVAVDAVVERVLLVDQLDVLARVELAVLKVNVPLNVRANEPLSSRGSPSLDTFFMFLS